MSLPPLTFRGWLRWDVARRRLPPLQHGDVVLEVGAGQGGVGARLAEMATYVGVEPDRSSRTVAASRLPAGASVVADVEDVDATADVLCSFEVLEHLDDDVGNLQDWVARVRPGGTVVVSVPAWAPRFGPSDEAVGHVRRYEVADLRNLLSAVGLIDIRIDAYGFPLGSLLDRIADAVASRRPPPSSDLSERTAASGRLYQPPMWLRHAVAALAWPFRLAQRPFRAFRLGMGLVAVARKPSAKDSGRP